jgi:hypothetical protein
MCMFIHGAEGWDIAGRIRYRMTGACCCIQKVMDYLSPCSSRRIRDCFPWREFSRVFLRRLLDKCDINTITVEQPTLWLQVSS